MSVARSTFGFAVLLAVCVSLCGISRPAQGATIDASAGMGGYHEALDHYHDWVGVTWSRSDNYSWGLYFNNAGATQDVLLAQGTQQGYDPYNGSFSGSGDASYLLYNTGTAQNGSSWYMMVLNYYNASTMGFEQLFSPTGGQSASACAANLTPWSDQRN